jgi:hypothetical protein
MKMFFLRYPPSRHMLRQPDRNQNYWRTNDRRIRPAAGRLFGGGLNKSKCGAVTKMLDENGCSGVPLYLYYTPGTAVPVILPRIITEAAVLSVIGSKHDMM